MGVDTARISVRVSARSKRSEIVGPRGEAWKVTVTAPPERGLANDAVVRLLAEACRVTTDRVTVVIGRGGRDKVIEVDGITTDEAERRIAASQRRS
jgi:uncharacterized protein (TIGR00251 family)